MLRHAHSAQWLWIKRTATVLFALLILSLLVMQARKYDWEEVVVAIRAYDVATLLVAAMLAVLTYSIYSCFDLVGCRYARIDLGAFKIMSIAFISYIFNQNFGALIGTVGMRMRLYSSVGIRLADTSKIVLLSIVTNWLGYITLAGVLLSLRQVQLPVAWQVGPLLLQVIGLIMLSLAGTYVWLCGGALGRELVIYKARIALPSRRLALVQLFLSMAHWPATAGIIYILLHGSVDFASILITFMLASVAVVIAHLPAGIGVLEGVFIVLLGTRVPHVQLLAAIMVFRGIAHIGPLLIAGVMYATLEAKIHAGKAPARSSSREVARKPATSPQGQID